MLKFTRDKNKVRTGGNKGRRHGLGRYRKPMGDPWKTHGPPMGHPWATHGPALNTTGNAPALQKQREYPRAAHERPMVGPSGSTLNPRTILIIPWATYGLWEITIDPWGTHKPIL